MKKGTDLFIRKTDVEAWEIVLNLQTQEIEKPTGLITIFINYGGFQLTG